MEECVLTCADAFRVWHTPVNTHNYRFRFPAEWEAVVEHQDIWLVGVSSSSSFRELHVEYRNVEINLHYHNTNNSLLFCDDNNILSKFQCPVVVDSKDKHDLVFDDGYIHVSSTSPDITVTVQWMPMPSSNTSLFFSLKGETISTSLSRVYLHYFPFQPDRLVENCVYVQYNGRDGEPVPAERLELDFGKGDNCDHHDVQIVSPTTICLMRPPSDFSMGCAGDEPGSDLNDMVSCNVVKVRVKLHNLL